MRRAPMLDRLRSGEDFEILVIGGGATGLGAAVEAATRGYRVALVEREDFAKGTSGRSTKLVHGGVRYLKQGDVPLVRGALRERGRLLRNAPHVARDLAFVIPSYSWFDRMFYGAGLKVYDALAGELGLGGSRVLSRAETLAALPNARSDGLVGGVLYHDGQFDDARLAVNLAQTAVERGAVVVNHCETVGLVKENTKVVGVELRDRETGAEFVVRARSVINATGVFVDALRQQDEPAAPALVTVSQGIHLVLPKRFMPGAAALMVPKTADGRVLFAVPWHDVLVVGTTDTPVARASAEPRALAEERAFVMEHARRYLAEAPGEADVLSVFAGLRPLVKKAGAHETAKLSRDHTLVTSASGLITVTGGKWTTYRKMGEDVVDQAERVLGVPHRPSVTATLPLHGAELRATMQGEARFAGYGADAKELEHLIAEDAALGERVHPRLPLTRAEVVWHAREEMARTVEDVLARRSRCLLLNAAASIEAAPVVAELLATELGRDTAWRAREVEGYTTVARGYVFTDPSSSRSSG